MLLNVNRLDIAASTEIVHAVMNLVKKRAYLGADESQDSRLRIVEMRLEKVKEYTERKNLERCAFIVECWDGEDDWK